jgi:hypothetical protein
MSYIDDWMEAVIKPLTGPAREEPKPEGDRLKDFFFPKKHNLTPHQDSLRREGRCPYCGAEGRISMSAFVCDMHGEF